MKGGVGDVHGVLITDEYAPATTTGTIPLEMAIPDLKIGSKACVVRADGRASTGQGRIEVRTLQPKKPAIFDKGVSEQPGGIGDFNGCEIAVLTITCPGNTPDKEAREISLCGEVAGGGQGNGGAPRC